MTTGAARWVPGAVLVASAAWIAILTRAVASDSLESYPMVFPDSFDWITNALRYTGIPLQVSWRAVLTPFIQAGLFALHAEWLIPLLGPCWFIATVLALVTLGRRLVGEAALWAAVLFAANHHVLAHGLVIGSDMLMIALNTTGLLATGLAVEEREPRWLLLAVPVLALGWLAQPLAPLLAPTLAALLLARGPGAARALASWRTAAGALALGVLVLVAAEGLRFGLTGVSSTTIERPFGFPAGHLVYYLWASLAVWSWPVLALVVTGAAAALRDDRCRPLAVVALVLIATHILFFGLVYDWRDGRFTLYWTVPALLLAGTALARLRPAVRWPVLAAAVLWTNLTVTPDASSHEIAAVWWPGRASVLDYYSSTLRPAAAAPYPFRDALRRWARERRRTFTNARADDPIFSRDRMRAMQAAAALATSDTPLWFQPAADAPVTHKYILRNQLALYARRTVPLVDGPPPGTSGILVAPVAVAERLLAEATGARATVVTRGPRYVVMRVGP